VAMSHSIFRFEVSGDRTFSQWMGSTTLAPALATALAKDLEYLATSFLAALMQPRVLRLRHLVSRPFPADRDRLV
jgi:hypothetical protein